MVIKCMSHDYHMTYIHHFLHVLLNGSGVGPGGVTRSPLGKGHYIRGFYLHTRLAEVLFGFQIERYLHQCIVSHLYVHHRGLKGGGWEG